MLMIMSCLIWNFHAEVSRKRKQYNTVEAAAMRYRLNNLRSLVTNKGFQLSSTFYYKEDTKLPYKGKKKVLNYLSVSGKSEREFQRLKYLCKSLLNFILYSFLQIIEIYQNLDIFICSTLWHLSRRIPSLSKEFPFFSFPFACTIQNSLSKSSCMQQSRNKNNKFTMCGKNPPIWLIFGH